MSTAIRSRFTPSALASQSLPALREPVESLFGPEVIGLAGADLSCQWDATQFALRGRDYGSEFMTRMHHPFGEVLGALFLDAGQNALAYHSCFRGNKPSALSHLPAVAQTARQLGATHLILAYSMIFDPSATLPDIRRMHARMSETGVELDDFLLISPGQNTRSLLAPSLL